MKYKNFWIGTSVLSLGVLFFGITIFAFNNGDFDWSTGLPTKDEVQQGKPVKATHPQAFRQALLNLNQRAWEYDATHKWSYTDDSKITRVGIGTTAPSGKMVVQLPQWMDRDTDSQHVIFTNSGDDDAGLRFGVDSNSTNMIGLINVLNPGVTWGDLVLQDGGGNVGIGTASPEEKLDVRGNVKANSYLYHSDKRLKKDISKLENYRDILKIDAVRFNWKKDGKADVGIIAQEVQKYFPEFVHKSGDYLSVDYPKLAVPMLNLLQEQEERLNKQEKEIQKLREMIKKLQK